MFFVLQLQYCVNSIFAVVPKSHLSQNI